MFLIRLIGSQTMLIMKCRLLALTKVESGWSGFERGYVDLIHHQNISVLPYLFIDLALPGALFRALLWIMGKELNILIFSSRFSNSIWLL